MADLPTNDPAVSTDVVRDQDKIMLLLAYFGIFGLIPLLTVKDSEYVHWHAKQGLVLSVGLFVVEVAVGVVGAIMAAIVHVFAVAFGCLNFLLVATYLLVDIYCMVKAVGGQRYRVPVVADLADKLNI